MRSLERGRKFESLDASIGRIAYAYGFTNAPVTLSRKAVASTTTTRAGEELDIDTAASLALIAASARVPQPIVTQPPAVTALAPTQTWGSSRRSNGTLLSFAILPTRQAVANALVVKTVLSVAELAEFKDLSVFVSSIGDGESRKRFTRELGNFFRKNANALSSEVRHVAAHDPDKAYRALLAEKDALVERAPRPIDYLSESSRKVMLDTLALFESVGIPYAIEPKIAGNPGVHAELLFVIEGTDKHGQRVKVGSGGRYIREEKGAQGEPAVSMSIHVPETVYPEEPRDEPLCFVVHVGDAGKLRTFGALEALCRANVDVWQALMAQSLRDQMQAAQEAHAKYIAIIGQREALDNTVIIRTVSSQLQTIIPLDKLASFMASRAR